MKNNGKKKQNGAGEAAGRQKGYQAYGGRPGNDLLEDGQLRGVDAQGNVTVGTHGGPKRKPQQVPKRGKTPHHAR